MSREQTESTSESTDDLETIAHAVDDLLQTASVLETKGEQADLPVVERTARRLKGVATQLDDNLPPELYDGEH